MSVRFSLLSARNPIDRLSGDQNGYAPLSVPASGRADTESSDRSHNHGCPSEVAANRKLPARSSGTNCDHRDPSHHTLPAVRPAPLVLLISPTLQKVLDRRRKGPDGVELPATTHVFGNAVGEPIPSIALTLVPSSSAPHGRAKRRR